MFFEKMLAKEPLFYSSKIKIGYARVNTCLRRELSLYGGKIKKNYF